MSNVYVFDGFSVTKCMIFGYVLLVEYDDASTGWLPFDQLPYDVLYAMLTARGVPQEVREVGYKELKKKEPLFVDDYPY